ncbi:hypothetical protein RhiirC2_739548, partial [Rhizophagus irregularis]
MKEYWIAGCLGDNGEMIRLNRNNYIADALKILSNKGIYIYDHEVKNEKTGHKIMIVIL